MVSKLVLTKLAMMSVTTWQPMFKALWRLPISNTQHSLFLPLKDMFRYTQCALSTGAYPCSCNNAPMLRCQPKTELGTCCILAQVAHQAEQIAWALGNSSRPDILWHAQCALLFKASAPIAVLPTPHKHPESYPSQLPLNLCHLLRILLVDGCAPGLERPCEGAILR